MGALIKAGLKTIGAGAGTGAIAYGFDRLFRK